MSVSGHRRQTDDVPPPTPGDPTTGAASSRPGTTAADARPTLIASRRTDASMGAASAMAIRDVLQTGPRVHRRRLRLSSGALIGVALAGSIGAVTAVNATLFPSLGRPTTESVWQNPGKVPSTEAEGTEPTTPRATPVLVVEPTAPPVVSAESARALTTTLPASSDAPTSSADVLAVAQPTTAKPTGSGSGSGTVTGTTIATVPASAPVTTSGTKSGSGGSSSSTSGTATTDHPSTSTPSTDPSTTDATVPTDTSEGAPGDTVDDGDSGGGGNSGSGSGRGRGKGGGD
jgi:hypothetical protein